MAATVSAANHGPFQPAFPRSHAIHESQKAARYSARKRGVASGRPMEYIDPGRAELRSVLVRTNAAMHRTKSGQNYEKAVRVVNAEYWKPPKPIPGEWFPNVGQVFDLRKGDVDATKVDHLCEILKHMPFLFKAIDRIKISWLRNNYPLPLRIVRALDRDDFELISSNFPGPIGDVNRYPGAMWTMTTDGSKTTPKRTQQMRRDTVTRYSRPFDKTALAADPSAVPKTIVPHRRDWNRLVHRYLDDSSAAGDMTGWPSVRMERPVSRLMEPLYPPWQLVQEAEESDRRVSNLSTVSAEDAKLIMKRCRQLKNRTLAMMDQHYKAKIHKLEDNREQRYRRKVSYLVPPYRTAGADMPAIRRRVQRRSRLEDVTLRSAAWYGRLLQLCAAVGAADTPRCQELLEHLLPFSRRDGSQISRGSEKLCLLLMSVPYYDALQQGLQMAILFVHVHFLRGSENVFRRWLEARSLADATKSSPLLALVRGELAPDHDSSSSSSSSSSSDDESVL
ncbi:hypothetical protein FJT64_009376 [Amphibalanus amphitrite]|uniref:Uncharacterized protein n=1 Tax=Amphibalanus amphitrite TaxID=1232801 RepID=A0A6A4VPN6_AMPAM|nr:hypothetical protein FJT64_009376 [Amphibalanus amphitrite]